MHKILPLITLALSVACGSSGLDGKKRSEKRQDKASDERTIEATTSTATTTSTSTNTNESLASDQTPTAPATSAPTSTDATVDEWAIEPEVLDLPGLQHASLREYAVETRCDAIKDAVASFVSQHAEGVVFENRDCERRFFFDDIMYRSKFDLVKGDTRRSYELWIYKMYESELAYKFEEVQGDSARIHVHGPNLYDPRLARLAPGLGHLHATLASFVGKPTLEQTIFGHTYREFIAQVASLAAAGGIEAKRGDERLPIKFELLPDEGSEGRYGKVRFIDVPPELLDQERSPITGRGLLGCTTIECLNDGLKTTFEIEENTLRISRPTSENSSQIMAWGFGDFPALPEE